MDAVPGDPRRIEFMRKVTVTIALFIAVLSVLATPLAAQTPSGLTLTTPYPGLTVEPGDTAEFDLIPGGLRHRPRSIFRWTASRRDGPPASGAAASS